MQNNKWRRVVDQVEELEKLEQKLVAERRGLVSDANGAEVITPDFLRRLIELQAAIEAVLQAKEDEGRRAPSFYDKR